jgi:hypothetical protein
LRRRRPPHLLGHQHCLWRIRRQRRRLRGIRNAQSSRIHSSGFRQFGDCTSAWHPLLLLSQPEGRIQWGMRGCRGSGERALCRLRCGCRCCGGGAVSRARRAGRAAALLRRRRCCGGCSVGRLRRCEVLGSRPAWRRAWRGCGACCCVHRRPGLTTCRALFC